MMKVQIIQVPYDSRHRSFRMGAGPEHLVRNGVAQIIEAEGYDVQVDSIEATSPYPHSAILRPARYRRRY